MVHPVVKMKNTSKMMLRILIIYGLLLTLIIGLTEFKTKILRDAGRSKGKYKFFNIKC